jgi:hypothetical protein
MGTRGRFNLGINYKGRVIHGTDFACAKIDTVEMQANFGRKR